ncbi:MAG: helix-turn-helix transcriptional regulator [Chlamydiota bacterium]
MDIKNTPIPARRALKKLGQDLQEARKRRHLPMQLVAQRAAISRITLSKIERGNETVSIGAYARVLFVLGLVEKIANIADPSSDKLGLTLDAENLPKRIRIPKKEKRSA